MGLVEGISATIAKHNPEVDFQTIWASDSEEPVLDIHYREAITDLENFLARFTSETSGLFDLQAQADDFSISIRTMSNWPPRLSGVLSNLVQNYLAHAMVAGWLSDFPDIKTTDYAGMGASDLDAIKGILLKKDFCFREVARHGDEELKEIAEDRGVEARGADGESKVEAASGVEARAADAEAKVEASAGVGARFSDRVVKDAGGGVRASERNRDFMSQHFHEDRVDWGGGVATLDFV